MKDEKMIVDDFFADLEKAAKLLEKIEKEEKET